MDTSSRAPRRWAGAAVGGMHACAVVAVLDTLLVGAKYEDRIVVFTHGAPDVPVLWWLVDPVELIAPLGTVLVATGWAWAVALLVTAVAFLGWLVRARVSPGQLPGRWWLALLVAMILGVIGGIRRTAVIGRDISTEHMIDTRAVTYLLWAAGAAAIVYTAATGVRAVRRITQAREVPAAGDQQAAA